MLARRSLKLISYSANTRRFFKAVGKRANAFSGISTKSEFTSPGLFNPNPAPSMPPKLPLLESITKECCANLSSSKPLLNTGIIYVHHALKTSPSVVAALQGLGADKIAVLGKKYSQCSAVEETMKALGVDLQENSEQAGLAGFYHSFVRDINWLWANHMRKIGTDDNLLVMDHGGHAIAFTPPEMLKGRRVIGIEKTTAGLMNPSAREAPYMVIRVADCAIKKFFESPLIAEAIVTKLTPYIPIKTEDKKLSCGVVGFGAVGRAVTQKLLSMGHKVMVYDHDPAQLQNTGKAVITKELAALVAYSDYVFGCTGQDITKSIDVFRLCNRDRTLISCSSEDKEFLSLLQHMQKIYNGKVSKHYLTDLEYKTEMDATIRILRGGFPINFDNSGESVPEKDIQLTRALVLGAVFQAIHFFENPNLAKKVGGYMLDPKLQKFIVNEWLKYQPPGRFSRDLIEKAQNEKWIMENSGGEYEPCDILNNNLNEQSSSLTSKCSR